MLNYFVYSVIVIGGCFWHAQRTTRGQRRTFNIGAKRSMETSRVTVAIVAEAVTKIYEAALPAESFAKIVAFAISQPDDVDANEIVFRPTWQES